MTDTATAAAIDRLREELLPELRHLTKVIERGGSVGAGPVTAAMAVQYPWDDGSLHLFPEGLPSTSWAREALVHYLKDLDDTLSLDQLVKQSRQQLVRLASEISQSRAQVS